MSQRQGSAARGSAAHDAARGRSRSRAWWLWLIGGFLVGFGLLSLMTIGIFVLAGAVVVLLVARALSPSRGVRSVLVGVGLPFFWVAWLHRGGPGMRCWESANSRGCAELLNPLPFLLIGLVLLLIGVWPLLARRLRRSSAGASSSDAPPGGPS